MNINDAIQTVMDAKTFVESHPAISTTLATYVTAEAGLPFVKQIKSNGVVHLIWNIFSQLVLKRE